MRAPPSIAWADSVITFIDGLVDLDIAYLDAQLAIEALVHAGLHDEITASFELNGHTIHWHRMPPLFPGLRPLDIFTTVEQSGLINVIHIRFSQQYGRPT